MAHQDKMKNNFLRVPIVEMRRQESGQLLRQLPTLIYFDHHSHLAPIHYAATLE